MVTPKSQIKAAFIAALTFSISTFSAHAGQDPMEWNETTILEGEPYVSAARCLALITDEPSIAFNGEYELLISIIANDPALIFDARHHNGGALYQTNPLYKLLDTVLWPMSFAASAMHDGHVPLALAKRLCAVIAAGKIKNGGDRSEP